MKKKFTEKQIVSFRIMVEDGIIKQLSDHPVLLGRIVSGLEVNEGAKGYLVSELIDSMNNKEKGRLINSLVKDYGNYIKHKVDRKSMIKMLGLRDYATKEDILKELNEIL